MGGRRLALTTRPHTTPIAAPLRLQPVSRGPRPVEGWPGRVGGWMGGMRNMCLARHGRRSDDGQHSGQLASCVNSSAIRRCCTAGGGGGGGRGGGGGAWSTASMEQGQVSSQVSGVNNGQGKEQWVKQTRRRLRSCPLLSSLHPPSADHSADGCCRPRRHQLSAAVVGVGVGRRHRTGQRLVPSLIECKSRPSQIAAMSTLNINLVPLVLARDAAMHVQPHRTSTPTSVCDGRAGRPSRRGLDEQRTIDGTGWTCTRETSGGSSWSTTCCAGASQRTTVLAYMLPYKPCCV